MGKPSPWPEHRMKNNGLRPGWGMRATPELTPSLGSEHSLPWILQRASLVWVAPLIHEHGNATVAAVTSGCVNSAICMTLGSHSQQQNLQGSESPRDVGRELPQAPHTQCIPNHIPVVLLAGSWSCVAQDAYVSLRLVGWVFLSADPPLPGTQH